MSNKDEELILVIPKNVLDPDNFKGSIEDFKNIVNKHGIYTKRGPAETDESLLQIIPYCVVQLGPDIFRYKRLKGGSEARLHAKYSIGIGGHVDYDKDHKFSSDPDRCDKLIYDIYRATVRELNEELTIPSECIVNEMNLNIFSNKEGKFLLYDNTNAVGRVHLGIVFIISLSHASQATVAPNEPTKMEGYFCSPVTIYNTSSDLYENWTKELLEWIIPTS